jgi:hypothetical protein
MDSMPKNPNQYPQATLRITAEMQEYIRPDREGHYSAPTREFIEFAAASLSRATKTELDGKFTADELSAIIDACNGTLWETLTLDYMDSEIGEASGDDSLAQRVRGLSYTARWALLLFIRRYWEANRAGEAKATVAGFARLGIVTAED